MPIEHEITNSLNFKNFKMQREKTGNITIKDHNKDNLNKNKLIICINPFPVAERSGTVTMYFSERIYKFCLVAYKLAILYYAILFVKKFILKYNLHLFGLLARRKFVRTF